MPWYGWGFDDHLPNRDIRPQRREMKHVRPLVESLAVDTGFRGYRAQFAAQLESALVISSWIAEGGCGPALHYHTSDQIYFMTQGRMTVRLGAQEHQAVAGDLVFIPAGLPHCNWNTGPGPEHHLELIAPAPRAGRPLANPVDGPDIPAGFRPVGRRGRLA
jgi:quercetin dioxygenase-like cupin family protein